MTVPLHSCFTGKSPLQIRAGQEIWRLGDRIVRSPPRFETPPSVPRNSRLSQVTSAQISCGMFTCFFFFFRSTANCGKRHYYPKGLASVP